MAYALTCGRPHRASGELAYHVLDVMQAFEDASLSDSHRELTSDSGRDDGSCGPAGSDCPRAWPWALWTSNPFESLEESTS